MRIEEILKSKNLKPKTRDLGEVLVGIYDALEIALKNPRRHIGNFGKDLDNKLPRNCRYSEKLYPRLEYSFNEAEIELLTDWVKCTPTDLQAVLGTALEKLLYSALWKNGDLQKVQYIIRGIVDLSLEGGGINDDDGPVFRQFGRHLSDPANNPIADQHTIRAQRYVIDRKIDDKAHTRAVKSRDVVAYVKWVKTIFRREEGNRAENIHAFDKKLFSIGKATKVWIAMCETDRKAKTP